ncbi:MAG: type II toxin-antitoxin system RelE/ParE family toxin [Verrucomicrobia bacterium]|nr:type II toxin-antitoxin system RelE/ParE family toxin [Verrucomicrobiota bacterium]
MGYSLGFASQAIEEFDRVIDYIASHNPPASIRFKKALLRKVELLKIAPEMGVALKRRSDIRFVVHRSYLIFYYIDHCSKRVEILRFLHAARDMTRIRF